MRSRHAALLVARLHHLMLPSTVSTTVPQARFDLLRSPRLFARASSLRPPPARSLSLRASPQAAATPPSLLPCCRPLLRSPRVAAGVRSRRLLLGCRRAQLTLPFPSVAARRRNCLRASSLAAAGTRRRSSAPCLHRTGPTAGRGGSRGRVPLAAAPTHFAPGDSGADMCRVYPPPVVASAVLWRCLI